jgi:hypothetical protein
MARISTFNFPVVHVSQMMTALRDARAASGVFCAPIPNDEE